MAERERRSRSLYPVWITTALVVAWIIQTRFGPPAEYDLAGVKKASLWGAFSYSSAVGRPRHPGRSCAGSAESGR
jgi:hypothetical protein